MAALNQCIFSKNIGRLSSVGPEILAFVSHWSTNFQPILNCSVPNFKSKYEDSENAEADRVNTVVFNLIKSNVGLFGTPEYIVSYRISEELGPLAPKSGTVIELPSTVVR